MIARVGAADPGLFVLKSALRAAIVVPLAFALVAGGDRRQADGAVRGLRLDGAARVRRLRRRRGARACAHICGLLAAGAVLIALGTLCSRSTLAGDRSRWRWSAFAILFAGVLDDYIAAAHAARDAHVRAAGDGARPARRRSRRGWPAGGSRGRCRSPAALLLWPARPRDALPRTPPRGGARARASWSRPARAVKAERPTRRRGAGARTTVGPARPASSRSAQRPSGTAGPTAALAPADRGPRLAAPRVADRVPALRDGERSPAPAERAEIEAAAPAALRAVAARLDGDPSASRPTLDLARLQRAHDAFGRALLGALRGHCSPIATRPRRPSSWTRPTGCASSPSATLLVGRGRAAGVPTSPSPAIRWASRAAATRGTRAGWRARTRALRLGVAAQQRARGRRAGARGAGRAADRPAARVLDRARDDVGAALQRARRRARRSPGRCSARSAGIVVGGLIAGRARRRSRACCGRCCRSRCCSRPTRPRRSPSRPARPPSRVVVLVLFNLIQPTGWRVGLVRVEDVAIGAAVSLLVGVLIWPRGADGDPARGDRRGVRRRGRATSTRRSRALLGEAGGGAASVAAREASRRRPAARRGRPRLPLQPQLRARAPARSHRPHHRRRPRAPRRRGCSRTPTR